MTKSLLRIIVLSTGLLVGLLQLQAQSRDKIEPFYPEVRALCDSVLSYISTPDDMKEPFILLLRKYGSNADQMYRAAEYFASKDNYSCSQFCIERAFGKKQKNTEILQLRAQIYDRVGKFDLASQSYDGILQVDSFNHYALMKAAMINRGMNDAAAFEQLLLVKEKYPEDTEADKQLGYQYNRLAEEASRDSAKNANRLLSVKHYGNWFFAEPVDSLNLSSTYCNQYIWNLYSVENYRAKKKNADDNTKVKKDFSKLIQVCNILEPVITRPHHSKDVKALKFWALVDTKQSQQAHTALAYLADKQFPDSLYQYFDYAMAGQFYSNEKNLPEAIKWQKQAVEKFPKESGSTGYFVLYDYYNNNEQYKEAIPTFKEYMARKAEEHLKDAKKSRVDLGDTATLAGAYYSLAYQAYTNKDNKILKEAVDCADSLYAYIANSRIDLFGVVASRVQVCQLLDETGDISLRTKECCEDAIARIDTLRIIKNDEFLNMEERTKLNGLIVTYYMRHGTKEEVMSQIMKYDDDYNKALALVTTFIEYDGMRKKDAKYFIEAYYYLKKYIEFDPNNSYRIVKQNLKDFEGLYKEKAEEQQRILEEKEAEEAALRAAEEAALKRLEEQEAAAKAEAERIAAEKAEAEKKAAEEAAAAAAQAATEAAATTTEEVKAAEEATDKKSKKKKSKKQKVEAEAETAAPTATEGTQAEEPKAETKAEKKSKKKKNKKADKKVEQTEEDKAKAEDTEVKTEEPEAKKEEAKAEEEKTEEPAQEKTEEEVKE